MKSKLFLYDLNGNTNLLTNVNDEASFGNTDGFTDGNTNPALDDYEYDANGNMVKDRNKGIEGISYNHLNLPRQIMWENMSSVTYMYNALGQKVSKIVTYPDGSIKPVDYLDGFQYAGEILQFFPHPEGYVDVLARIVDDKPYTYRYKYVYNYTDHLGNIRMSYTLNPQNNKLEILEENHYFPFGLKHSTYIPADKKMLELIVKQNEEKIKIKVVQETEYQYKYNGKEWQDELGLNFYDYGARNYDPAIGRWMNMDPLAEKFMDMSPYNYALNNPVFFIDPDGQAAQDIIKVYKHSGKIEVKKAAGDDVVQLVDKKGNVIKENGKEKSYTYGENGSFLKENRVSYENTLEGVSFNSIKGTPQTRISFEDVDKANTFFEFAAQSDVEFSLMTFSIGCTNFKYSEVITNHTTNRVYGSADIIDRVLSRDNDTYLTQDRHNHPGGNPTPSGFNNNLTPNNNHGDRLYYKALKLKHGNQIKTKGEIYVPSKGSKPSIITIYDDKSAEIK